MTAPLRAGVIGLGWAGRQHMDAYVATTGTELVAIAGKEPDLLGVLGDTYSLAPVHRFDDWRQLVDSRAVDVLSVATPTALHAPVAIAALDAGLHVLCEKPMAENPTAASAMVAAAERNGRVLDVSFNHRRRGDVQALKQVIDARTLGRIYYAKAGWLRRAGIPGMGSWFTRSELSGGGPLMDIGVHMLDIALYLLGEPHVGTATAATYAEFGPRGRGRGAHAAAGFSGDAVFDVEDLATAFLRLDGGATLLLESSWAQWIPHDQCYVAIYGSDGGASIEWGGGDDAPYRRLDVWTADKPDDVQQPTVGPDGGHARCVADFVAAVDSGTYAGHRGREALVRAEVVDACYASARSGHEVTIAPT